MYEPNVISTTISNRDYDTARVLSSQFLADRQADFERYRDLVLIESRAERPLMFAERLALADACSKLAGAYDRAAAVWEQYRPGLGLARAQRQEARQLRDRAALNRAVAVIAPTNVNDNPFGQ